MGASKAYPEQWCSIAFVTACVCWTVLFGCSNDGAPPSEDRQPWRGPAFGGEALAHGMQLRVKGYDGPEGVSGRRLWLLHDGKSTLVTRFADLKPHLRPVESLEDARGVFDLWSEIRGHRFVVLADDPAPTARLLELSEGPSRWGHYSSADAGRWKLIAPQEQNGEYVQELPVFESRERLFGLFGSVHHVRILRMRLQPDGRLHRLQVQVDRTVESGEEALRYAPLAGA